LWDLHADPNQLAQVISNVVLNAIEATPGSGTIRVRADNVTRAPHLPDGIYVEIRVAGLRCRHCAGFPGPHL